MKKLITLIFVLLYSISPAQIIPSSCDGSPDLLNIYKPEATRLTSNWLKTTQSPDNSLVIIPDIQLDSVLGALVAVFNATSLPGHDALLVCHSRTPQLHNLVLLIDTTTIWNISWSQDILLTGDATMDSIIVMYDFSIIDYVIDLEYGGAFVEFYTPQLLNPYALTNLFLNFSGIEMAFTSPFNSAPHSSSINYKTEDGIRKLTYSFGWGDCIAGCIHWKHWNIKVYNDCSVELVGHDPDYTYVSDFNKIETINLSPNPFNDLIVIETKNNYNYDIISLTGITLIKGELFVGENIIETNDLPGGVYVIYIYDSKSYSTYVIIKRDF